MMPRGWNQKPLAEVASFLDGKRVPLKEGDRQKRKGKYPYYGASGIIDYIDDYIFDEPLILLGEDGENIVSRNLPLAFKATGKYWVNNHAHVIKPNGDMDIDFLVNYLESLNYEKFNSGTAQPKLNKATCESIPILVPPKDEQEKISKILSTWDEAIEKLAEVIIKKQRRKSSLTNSLLTGKKRFSEFGLPRNQDTSIPNGWKNIKLSAFTEKIGSGKTPKGGESAYSDSGILFIRSQNVYPNQLRLNDLTFISKDIDASMKNSRVIKMDVLLNITGASIGRCCVYKDDAPANVNQHVCIIRTKSEIDPAYLSYFLNSDSGQKQIKSYLTRGNREGLNFQQIGSFEVPIPPTKPEQTKIARFLTILDEEIEVLGRSMVKLQTQKQGLMQQLLTGKKRVKV